MTSSLEGKARWPGIVLGKIKSLWSSSQGTASNGLNQLIGSSGKIAGRETLSNSMCIAIETRSRCLEFANECEGTLKSYHTRVSHASRSVRSHEYFIFGITALVARHFRSMIRTVCRYLSL